jgi:hypothetical protein
MAETFGNVVVIERAVLGVEDSDKEKMKSVAEKKMT